MLGSSSDLSQYLGQSLTLKRARERLFGGTELSRQTDCLDTLVSRLLQTCIAWAVGEWTGEAWGGSTPGRCVRVTLEWLHALAQPLTPILDGAVGA